MVVEAFEVDLELVRATNLSDRLETHASFVAELSHDLKMARELVWPSLPASNLMSVMASEGAKATRMVSGCVHKELPNQTVLNWLVLSGSLVIFGLVSSSMCGTAHPDHLDWAEFFFLIS